MALYDLTFKENFKILVAGPSACGKTVSVFKFVTNLPLYARKKIDVMVVSKYQSNTILPEGNKVHINFCVSRGSGAELSYPKMDKST